MANNKRNARTTFPRKTARRERALDRFVVMRKRMADEAYMERKHAEWTSLTGSATGFGSCVQRVFTTPHQGA